MKPKSIKTAARDKRMADSVYKIFTEEEWNRFQESGRFSGSADDRRDGFIHLSNSQQVAGVIERFFADKRPLYVAEFSDTQLLQAEFSDTQLLQVLLWEPSAAGESYPHLYGRDLLAKELSGFIKL